MFGEFHARAETEHAARSWRRKLADRVKPSPREKRHLNAGDRLKMIADPVHYADYFTEWAQNYAVVGEITPSYASLSAKDFAFIRELLEPHFDLRIVLLLRDPVERAYSASRHFRRVNRGRFDVVLRENNNDLFERLFDTPYVWERADYPRIFSNLEAVFSRSEIHVEFYERLFTEAAVERLCDFLGIEPIPADFGKIVNASPRPNELDPALAAEARADLRANLRILRPAVRQS